MKYGLFFIPDNECGVFDRFHAPIYIDDSLDKLLNWGFDCDKVEIKNDYPKWILELDMNRGGDVARKIDKCLKKIFGNPTTAIRKAGNSPQLAYKSALSFLGMMQYYCLQHNGKKMYIYVS